MTSLEGQVAIVTGGGAGIGRAIALEAARQGASVAALDINEPGAHETAEMIVKAGGKALGLACDVSKPAELSPLIERVAGELGAPSLLFNVAAIVKYAHIEDTDLELFNRILSINLTGAFAMTKAVLPHLTAKKGAILNVASMAGTLGVPYLSAYSAAKGGLCAMTKSMAKELSVRGVRVNAIAPGGVDTAMLKAPFPEDASEEVMRLIPMSPIGLTSPEAIATFAVFIASPASGNLSGAIIPIDGASS